MNRLPSNFAYWLPCQTIMWILKMKRIGVDYSKSYYYT